MRRGLSEGTAVLGRRTAVSAVGPKAPCVNLVSVLRAPDLYTPIYCQLIAHINLRTLCVIYKFECLAAVDMRIMVTPCSLVDSGCYRLRGSAAFILMKKLLVS